LLRLIFIISLQKGTSLLKGLNRALLSLFFLILVINGDFGVTPEQVDDEFAWAMGGS